MTIKLTDPTGHFHDLLDAETTDFVELVRIAGLDPARDFQGMNLRGLDLHNADLSGFNFTGADLSGAALRNADLREAVTADAVFEGALMAGCSIDRDAAVSEYESDVDDAIRCIEWARYIGPEKTSIALNYLKYAITIIYRSKNIEYSKKARYVLEAARKAVALAIINADYEYARKITDMLNDEVCNRDKFDWINDADQAIIIKDIKNLVFHIGPQDLKAAYENINCSRRAERPMLQFYKYYIARIIDVKADGKKSLIGMNLTIDAIPFCNNQFQIDNPRSSFYRDKLMLSLDALPTTLETLPMPECPSITLRQAFYILSKLENGVEAYLTFLSAGLHGVIGEVHRDAENHNAATEKFRRGIYDLDPVFSDNPHAVLPRMKALVSGFLASLDDLPHAGKQGTVTAVIDNICEIDDDIDDIHDFLPGRRA